MKSKIFLVFVTVVFAVCLSGISSLFAQERMTYEEYQSQLAEWQQREEAAQARIQELEGEIAGLRERVADLESQIQDAENAIWRELGMSSREFDNYISDLNRLRRQIDGLLNLSPGELYRRRDEVERVADRLEELANASGARHPEGRRLINDIRRLLNRLENALANAQPPFDVYSVVRGDYLWKIARKPEIYNDAFQWIRIYTKNRDIIKNPDLIYPRQEFKIFHEVLGNEHLVMRGEYLSKIAGYANVYNDPFQWTKLFELNNDVIEDRDVIYPHMILFIR